MPSLRFLPPNPARAAKRRTALLEPVRHELPVLGLPAHALVVHEDLRERAQEQGGLERGAFFDAVANIPWRLFIVSDILQCEKRYCSMPSQSNSLVPSEGGHGGRRGAAEGRVEDLVAGPEADEHLPQAAMLPTESIQHTVLVADFQKKTNPPNFLQHFSNSSGLS